MTNNSVALHNLENGTIKFYDEEQKNIFEISEWLEGDELFGPWPFAPFVQNGKIYSFPMVINLTGWTGGDWLADIACMQKLDCLNKHLHLLHISTSGKRNNNNTRVFVIVNLTSIDDCHINCSCFQEDRLNRERLLLTYNIAFLLLYSRIARQFLQSLLP